MAGGEVIQQLFNEVGIRVDAASAAKAEAAMKAWEERAQALGNVVASAAGQLADFINQAHGAAKAVNRVNRSLEKSNATLLDYATSSTHAASAMQTASHRAANLSEEVSGIGRESWLAAKKTSALGTGLGDLAHGVREAQRAEGAAAKARQASTATHRAEAQAADESIGVLGRLGLALQGLRGLYEVAAGAAHLLVGGLVETSREMESSAKVSGVSARFFQEMAYAAASVRFQADDLRDVFVDLSDKVVSGGEDQKTALRELGVKVRDTVTGRLRPMEEVFLDLADGFAKMEDGTKKTAFASALLGEQGSRLLPVLSKGRAGLRGFATEAAEVGAVLDEDTLRASAEFNAHMGRLTAATLGARNVLGRALLPALTRVAEELVRVLKRLMPVLKSGAEKWGRRFSAAVEFMATGVDKLRLAVTLAAGVLLGKYLMAISAVTGAQLTWGSAALIAGARAAAGAALAVAPWLLLGSIVALAVDELYGFATGSESALGDFIKWVDRIDPEENNLVRLFKRASSLVFDFTDPKKWTQLSSSLENLRLTTFLEWLKMLFRAVEFLKAPFRDAKIGFGDGPLVERRSSFVSDAERQARRLSVATGPTVGTRATETGRDVADWGRMVARESKVTGVSAHMSGPNYRPRDWVARYGLDAQLPTGPTAPAAYFGRGASASTALPTMSRAAAPSVFAPTTTIQMTVQPPPGMAPEAVGAGAMSTAYDRAAEDRRQALRLFQEEG